MAVLDRLPDLLCGNHTALGLGLIDSDRVLLNHWLFGLGQHQKANGDRFARADGGSQCRVEQKLFAGTFNLLLAPLAT